MLRLIGHFNIKLSDQAGVLRYLNGWSFMTQDWVAG